MLFETICIKNGSIQHLSLHQMRLNRSQEALFEHFEPIDLGAVLHPPSGSGTLKCRVVYNENLLDISYEPYRPRVVHSLRIVESQIDYDYKFSNRDALDELYARRDGADDILIIRDGLVTTRERLIRSGFLMPRDIRVGEIGTFDAFALLNAMIGFDPVKHGKIV